MKSKPPVISVVLGGGGIKPFASIPLFSFFNQMNQPIDYIVGCSGGSILAAMNACGYSPDDIINKIIPRLKKSMFKANWKAVLSLAGLPFGRMDRTSAFFNPEPFKRFARDIYGDRKLEDLKQKIILQATDFQTGDGLGLEKGDLAEAVYASSALYPFFPPICLNGRWVFDGVFSAPLPLLQAVKKESDIIVVVDFLEKLQDNPHGPLDSIMHLSKLYSKTIMSNQVALSIDLHEAEIIYMKIKFEDYISMWEFDRIPEIIQYGEKALARVQSDILDVIRIKNDQHKR